MREIKFRGMNYETNEWVYGGYYKGTRVNEENVNITTKLSDCYVAENIIFDGLIYYIQNGETIGQYTGFKDKNGVEIYEGDIIKMNSKGINFIGYIEYNNGRYIVRRRSMLDGFYDLHIQNLELIGNIYEYKELIN